MEMQSTNDSWTRIYKIKLPNVYTSNEILVSKISSNLPFCQTELRTNEQANKGSV